MNYFNYNFIYLFIVIILIWNIQITDTHMNKTRERNQKIISSRWSSNHLVLDDVDQDDNPWRSSGPLINIDSISDEEAMKSSEWSSSQTLVSHTHDPWGSGTHKLTNEVHVNKKRKRSKRHVAHLYNMVSCATGCDPLSYKGYGCYCGFLGSGYVVDGIDSCCKMHDWCYQTANCPMFLEYFIPYLWKCYRGHRPLCAIEHGMWGGAGSCAQRLCECDRQLSMCLRRYPCPHTKAFCHSSPFRLLQNVFML